MSGLDGSQNNAGGADEQEVVQKIQYSRSDVATTRRALTDLEIQSSRLQDQLQRDIASANTASMDQFQAAWKKRETLNQVNGQIANLRETLEDMMPSPGKAKLSDQEKKEIKGLYQTGLYTQTSLAQQYGVSQPTVGDVVRDDKSKS